MCSFSLTLIKPMLLEHVWHSNQNGDIDADRRTWTWTWTPAELHPWIHASMHPCPQASIYMHHRLCHMLRPYQCISSRWSHSRKLRRLSIGFPILVSGHLKCRLKWDYINLWPRWPWSLWSVIWPQSQPPEMLSVWAGGPWSARGSSCRRYGAE